MKTRSRIIAVLGILILCAGLFVACNSEVSESSAVDTSKTAYLNFGGASKAIDASSISQEYDIKPVSDVFWVYKANKADHAGTTGDTGDAYLPVTTFTAGLNGTVGPFSVGRWTFDLIGYVGFAETEAGVPEGEDFRAVTINNVTKYYYGTIYEAHSATITLSESTATAPQAVSVDVVFAGEGTGTVIIDEGFFYWKDDKGGDVEEDGKILKMHLTMRPTTGSAIEKYILLDAVAYNVENVGNRIRYTPKTGETVEFSIPAGDYETDFAIEKWSTGDGAALESTLSGASNVTVKVYAKQTLKIDANFLENTFGYVTFLGVTPAPVLIQRLVLQTSESNGIVSSTQTITNGDLKVTYPEGTVLKYGTKTSEDGKTSDATTGFVYESTDLPVDPVSQQTIDIGTGNSNLKYELTINVADNNNTVLTVTKFIGIGRDVQTVYHNGSEMNKATGDTPVAETYSYDSATGILTLYVKHASPIDVVYRPAEVTDVVASVTHNNVVTNFATFEAAVAAAQDGDTITLLKNVTLDSWILFNGGKTITLNLAGNTLLSSEDGIHVYNAKLTVQNGTINGNNGQVFNVYGRTMDGDGNYSVLTIASNAEIVNAGFGVCVFPISDTVGYDTEVNLNGSITGECGIFVSGNLANEDSDSSNAMIASNVININSGSIISTTDQAIAMNGGATVNVEEGATLIGSEAIGLKRGTLNVTGGTLRATGDYAVPTANNNGTEASGAVVSITSTYNYARGIVANISGGTFEAANGHALAIQKTGTTTFSENALEVSITGGTFTAGSNPSAKAVYAAGGTATAFLTGGTYNTVPSDYVAIGYQAVADKPSAGWWTVESVLPGKGTEENPFLIGSKDDLLKINLFSDSMENGNAYYFKLTDDIDLRNESFSTKYVIKNFAGGLDGKKSNTESYKIYAPNDSYVNGLFDLIGNSTISNIEIVLGNRTDKVSLINTIWAGNLFKFKNVDFSSEDFNEFVYKVGHNSSLYFSYNKRYGAEGWGGNYFVEDCDVKLNLKGASSSNCAVFVGGFAYNHNNDSVIRVSNCTYEGTFRGNFVALVLSNGQNYTNYNAIDITGLVNKGTLIGTMGAYAVGAQNHTGECINSSIPVYYDQVQTTTGGSYYVANEQVHASVNEDGKVIISNKNENYTYKVSLYASRLIYNNNKIQWASNYNYAINFGSTEDVYRYKFVDYDTAIEQGYIIPSDCSEHWISANCEFTGDGTYQIVDKGTEKYYVLKFTTDNNLYSKFVVELQTPTVMVCAYDGSNNLVGLKEFLN